MSGDFPTDILAKRKLLLDRVEQIGVTLHEPGAKSEGLATLAPEAAKALRESGMFRLKLCTGLGVPRPISPRTHLADVAIWVVTDTYHFAGNAGLHHPHVLGPLLRDLNTAGLHQVMSDTAYENHGKFGLRLASDPLAEPPDAAERTTGLGDIDDDENADSLRRRFRPLLVRPSGRGRGAASARALAGDRNRLGERAAGQE